MEPTTAEAVARLTLVRALVRDAMNEDEIDPHKMQALKDNLRSKHHMGEGEVLHCLYVCGLHDGIEYVHRMRESKKDESC